MKNTHYNYKIITLAIIGILIYPSMATAIWWNPITWLEQEKELENIVNENEENLPPQGSTPSDTTTSNEKSRKENVSTSTTSSKEETETTELSARIENLKTTQNQFLSTNSNLLERISAIETSQKETTQKYEVAKSLVNELAERVSILEKNQQLIIEKYETLFSQYKKQITTIENTLNEVVGKLNQQGQKIKEFSPYIPPQPATEPFIPVPCYGGVCP